MATSPFFPDLTSWIAHALPARAARVARQAAWLREPLLHFALLGALLFAVDHIIASGRADPFTIVMSPEVDREARTLFVAARGREPDAAELQALRQRWLDNEVLYREGLAQQMDRGDAAIRERVIFKALSMVDAGTRLPAIDEAQLRRWFEQRRAKYDEPARYDFQEAVLSGAADEAAVRGFVDALNAGMPGDAQAGLRVFKARPHATVVQGYGAEFARALEQAAPGRWLAIQGKDGWRAMRLDAVTQPRPAVFEALRGVLLQDWTDATLAEQRSAAVKGLAAKYKLRVDGTAGAAGAGA